jgi:hypothetical protein
MGTLLIESLCTTSQCGSGTTDNMPYELQITYASSDIAKIASWLQAGAKEN